MNLRDQLKKAKLLSDKDARRLSHEARVERKVKGREGLEKEQEQRQQEIEAKQREQREKAKREQEARDRERRRQEELAAARALLAGAHKPGSGSVKFYFATADGSLPWLELSAREAQEIRAGSLCIVRTGPRATHTYGLVGLEAARRLVRAMPDVVVRAPKGVVPA